VLLGSSPNDAGAQETPVLKARARVRIWGEALPDSGLDARLFKIEADTVHVFGDSTLPRAIPVHQMRRFEVSRGRDPLLMVGVPMLGTLVGALLGPALMEEDTVCRLEIAEERECVKETSDTIVGAGAGFIITGVLVGILVKERWVAVPLDELALQLDLGSGQVQLLVAHSF
jgi:hypothetical protein